MTIFKNSYHYLAVILSLFFLSLAMSSMAENKKVRIIILDPGHFHAALLQKSNIAEVNDTIHVYAPKGNEINQYLDIVKSYNNRTTNPTHWVEQSYINDDFLPRMLTEHKGDMVVLAGNNKKKTSYIYESIKAGYSVLADKPLAITFNDYKLLKKAYALAAKKGLVIYDLMTERYDMMNIVERELIHDSSLYGEQLEGTVDQPAVSMTSVHHFCKFVSGKPVVRPTWYYDIAQQGEGIADVTTHLIDLINWQCFPDKEIKLSDVAVTGANHFPTIISLEQYKQSTGATAFPSFLTPYISNGDLAVMSNGNINYRIMGVNMRIDVRWDFTPSKGSDDSFSSIKRGSKATIEIVQDASTGYVRKLLVKKAEGVDIKDFKVAVMQNLKQLKAKYPFVSIENESDDVVSYIIPKENRLSHEEHFNLVAKSFLSYLNGKPMPKWENINTLTKYYITTKSTEEAKRHEVKK